MELPLKHGTALVDDGDAGRVRGHRWYSLRSKQRIYVATQIDGRTIYLHRFVLGEPSRGRGGGDIDHIDGNGLDNRRENLRLATRSQNNANSPGRGGSSRFKGVSWSSQAGAWSAHITANGTSRGLGYYAGEEDAAHAYDLAAVAAFGEFAYINFPDRLGDPAPGRFSARMRARQLATPIDNATTSDYRQGASNPNAKLTEADVREIIVALSAVPRESYGKIAARYGVTAGQIGHIAHRRTWRHLWPE